VDFFVVQGIADPAALHDELRVWAERQKAAGRIRYFGFTTHANMAPCLERAAGLAWIDGVVTAYNYRLMELADMRAAVDACAASGVALTAIKTQALPTNPAAEIGAESGAALDRLKRAAGGDPGAAKLRAVWSDPAVSSALSLMDAPLLRRNGDAARRPRLAATEAQALGERAQAESSWCAGCTRFCEARAPAGVPIGRILRALVYARGYGDLRRGRDILRDLPEAQRAALAHADYGAAERACPRGIAIGERMREAHARLA
jgi:predicted aldo/keto reductase-like oxidoreductase